MSFYGHPYVISPACYPQQQHGHQHPFQQRTPSPAFAQQQVQQRAPQASQADMAALANEERQALAYLQSVRRRREAAEAAAALEARERARAQAEREAALRAAAERHNQLIQAARRERALREALERERQREAAFAQAMQARRAEQVQAAIEAERRRQTAAAEAYARAVAEHRQRAAAPQAKPQAQAQAPAQPQTQPQAQTQPQTHDHAHPQTQEEFEEFDLDGLNGLLGQLFGFNIASQPVDAPREPSEVKKPAEKPAEKKTEEKPKETPAATSEPSAPDTTTVAKEAAAKHTDDGSELPEELNALLNQFLGLNIAPAEEGERGNPKAPQQLVGNAVQDLNAFLSQYGLEFVPEDETDTEEEEASEPPHFRVTNEAGWAALPTENDKNAAKPAASTEDKKAAEPTSTPAAATTATATETPKPKPTSTDKPRLPRQASREPDEDAPFTSTLGSYQQLPPYLRDILSQMEFALTGEEHEHDAECGCNPETRTPCARGEDGRPCAAHRRKHRRERMMEKKRQSKERKQARLAKRFGEATEDKSGSAGGIPAETSDAVAKEHQNVFADAARAATHDKVSAEEAKKEAIPADASVADVKAHRSIAEQAAEEVREHPIDVSKVVAAQEAREEAIPKDVSGAEVAEHRSAAAEAAKAARVESAAHSQLHADAPAFKPKAEKQKQQKQFKPSTPEAEAAIKTLDGIEAKLQEMTSSFKFPRSLAFAPSLADVTQPPLLYSRNNTAYHAQAHNLMQLLLAVDDVQSGGDKAVRQRRKQVVKEIEAALNGLERKRDDAWAEVRARRERGESDESEDEWAVGNTTDATSDLEA